MLTDVMIEKTFYGQAVDYLMTRGMSHEQACSVMIGVINAEENDVMKDRWQTPIEGYSPVMLNILYLSCNDYALQYIEKNCPQAWFRPMFVGIHI